MSCIVNGETLTLPPNSSVADLLRQLNYGDKQLAVEINGQIIPRGTFPSHPVQNGDHIEIVQAIGGG